MRLLWIIPIVLFASCCRSPERKPPTEVKVSGTDRKETCMYHESYDDIDTDDFLEKPNAEAIDIAGTESSKVDSDAYLDWPDRYDRALNEYTIADDGNYDEDAVDDEARKDSIENMNDS